jgi:hypothetical protein
MLFILLFALFRAYSQCSPDNNAPLIIAPPDLTLSNDLGFCNSTISASILSYPVTFDACGVTSVLPSNIPPGYVFPVGTTIITWTALDAAGNSATANQTVTVVDDEAPVFTCLGTINVSTTAGNCDAFVNVNISATDNCAIASITNDYTVNGADASGTYPIGTTTVTFTATDSANLTSTCSVDVTVSNTQLPVITLIGPNPLTIEACDPFVDPGATALDSCLGDISSDITVDTSMLDLNNVGTYDVIYNVTNIAGIAAVPMTRTINIVDTTPPTLTLIGPSVLNVGICSVYTELGALALDPCFGDISSNLVIDNSTVDTNTLGTYTVTYNLTDDNGNSTAQIIRTVNVIDATAPEIVLLGDNPQIIESCNGYTELGATAIDPCSLENFTSNLIIDDSLVNPNAVGTYQVTYNVMDNDGNVALEVIRDIEIVDTTAPVITLLGDNPQIISACTPFSELGATAIDLCTGTDYTASLVIDSSAIDINNEGIYQITYDVCDSYGNCTNTIIRNVEVVISNPIANAGSDITNSVCTDTSITLSGNPVNGVNASGLWTVTSGQVSGFSFSDMTSPTAIFTGDIGETYTLLWTIDNPEPCADVSDSIDITFINCSALDFDGVDDNITFRDHFNLNGDFSIELWMKSETQNNDIQTLLSKRESSNLIDGYDLRVENNYISFNWNNGESLTSLYPITTNKWYHLAITNSNGTFRLYIDGILVNNTSGSIPISNTVDCLVGAMDETITPPFKPSNYFDGGIDELRIWDIALTSDQIRKMMNQEIENNSSAIRGSIIPIDIAGVSWSNLNGYFRMNQNSDLSSGNILSSNSSPINGLLRYMTTLQSETAPIPYISVSNGTWNSTSTWLHGSVQAIPNSMGIDGSTMVDWNIIESAHNISSGDKNITLLGLNIINNQLSIENTNSLDGQSLRITDYLKIDGILSLVGESQLLQDPNSILDYTGSGLLKRDQQGTSNLYNYNYWSSPVSANGISYQLEDILFEGSQPVLWTSAQDANPNTTPITMSNRWLYTYENFPTNSYADWQSINEDDAINVGLGFLMKGSGATSTNQNYTFVGQPNNGTISTPITADYVALVGNPYPSAIDSHEFIFDNNTSIQGSIYYWEHYNSNATHILEDYEGGYASYNLSGGNPAVSPPEISGLGTSLKIPERYIPVGQGFFVQAGSSNGQVTFENDQRVFIKELVTGPADNGSVFIRTGQEEQVDLTNENPIKRLRIHFKTPENAVRPLLLAFTPNNEASDGFDYGYDAINNETFPNDMSWIINDQSYIIQGVGDFDNSKMYPLGLFMTTSGAIKIGLDQLENFENNIDVFVYDALTDSAFQINDTPFSIELENNIYINRFFISFQPTSTLSITEQLSLKPTIQYLHTENEIYIKLLTHLEAKSLTLYNMLGQQIKLWNAEELNRIANEIRIPTKLISEGVYVVKLTTNDGSEISKKIIIKY